MFSTSSSSFLPSGDSCTGYPMSEYVCARVIFKYFFPKQQYFVRTVGRKVAYRAFTPRSSQLA
jgi:hypothetical protein